MNEKPIFLADDTISRGELSELCQWILAGNRLTKGEQTLAFESEFGAWIGAKYSIFTNSGSSSNLLMVAGLKEAGYLKNNKVVAPAVSWVTTVSPLMQLGFDVTLCDCDPVNLGLNIAHLTELCEQDPPSLIILVHVLGHANDMRAIDALCEKYGILLIEDACEALGSQIDGKYLGNLSLAGSFSFYYGHHISTIEGGMVVTSDFDLYQIMLSLRSHGWSRDLSEETRKGLSKQYDIDEFRNLYTFYYPGFNLRSTDLQAFLGRSQLQTIERITEIRQSNFETYRRLLNDYYSQESENSVTSSFAFGTLVANRNEVHAHLSKNRIECRPLICGNIGRHPFWLNKFGPSKLPLSDTVHDYGIYLPNHHNLTTDDVERVCNVFKDVAVPLKFST